MGIFLLFYFIIFFLIKNFFFFLNNNYIYNRNFFTYFFLLKIYARDTIPFLHYWKNRFYYSFSLFFFVHFRYHISIYTQFMFHKYFWASFHFVPIFFNFTRGMIRHLVWYIILKKKSFIMIDRLVLCFTI